MPELILIQHKNKRPVTHNRDKSIINEKHTIEDKSNKNMKQNASYIAQLAYPGIRNKAQKTSAPKHYLSN